MKNTTIGIGIVIVLILGFGGYYMISNNNFTIVPTNSSDINNSPISTNPTPTTTPTPANVTVDIKNFAFNPPILNIKVGTKVVWTNNGSAPHNITSNSGGILSSATLSTGQFFSFTFTKTGSFSYHCAIHPMMKGIVVVIN